MADAGPDQTVNEGATVMLDGSNSSDSDGDPLTYEWSDPEGISLSATMDPIVTFTAPDVMADKDYRFNLTVTDTDNLRAPGKIDHASDARCLPIRTKPVLTRVCTIPQALPGESAAIFRGSLSLRLSGESRKCQEKPSQAAGGRQ